MAKSIAFIKDYTLNTETAIVAEIKKLYFFVGHINELLNWEDWNVHFSIAFEKYSAEFSEKTQ